MLQAEVWDFDGDGWLDLAYCDALPDTCFFNKEGKKFEPMGFAFGQLCMQDPLDLNGDGYLDTYSIREGMQFLYDPAKRVFTRQPHVYPLPDELPQGVRAILTEHMAKSRFLQIKYFRNLYLTADGRAAMAAGAFGSYSGPAVGRYLVADKDGKFADATEELGLPMAGTPIAFADLAGKGLDDVLVAADERGGLFLNDGKAATSATRAADGLPQDRGAQTCTRWTWWISTTTAGWT